MINYFYNINVLIMIKLSVNLEVLRCIDKMDTIVNQSASLLTHLTHLTVNALVTCLLVYTNVPFKGRRRRRRREGVIETQR